LAFCALAVGACGAPDEEAKPRLPPDEPRKLSPGAYRTEEFEPAFSFEVREGWSHEGSETSDALLITRGQGIGGLGFAKIREVYVYKHTRTSGTVVGAPEDLVGWFRGHPYLETTQRRASRARRSPPPPMPRWDRGRRGPARGRAPRHGKERPRRRADRRGASRRCR
jgi:hypothetical protein